MRDRCMERPAMQQFKALLFFFQSAIHACITIVLNLLLIKKCLSVSIGLEVNL